MFGYTSIYDKSMNGVKVLSDGISIISDGIAQHENVIYSEFIKSQDNKTLMINNQLTTELIDCQQLTADDIMSLEINTDTLKTKNLKIIDASGNEIFIGDGTNHKFTFNGQSDFYEPLTVINNVINQTQGGYIYQTGTNFNTFKDSKINGFLEIGSNITQTGGSTILKDLTVDNINMNTNKGISQIGSGTSNTFGSSTITNLTILDSVIFPSSVVIPGTTTSDDIIMNGSSVITQDTTVSTTKFNKFRYTKTLDLDIDGNISQTKAGATATLKDTIIEGTTTLQGDIEQTAGFTKLNTIECNNITLRTNNDLNISGTGKISQSGTGENTMNAIVLNNNQNITFNGSGIISQPLNGINILSHFRGAGFGIIGGRNNTTYSHYQNIQNNNGLQFQYNRDNATFYSYFLNNKSGSGGGFRFQRYNGGVYVDEPLIIDDNISIYKDVSIIGKSLSCSSATIGIISQDEINCLDNCNINILNKFNILDSEITSLQATAGSVSTATSGITYSSGNDTTTIDNNLTVSNGKTFLLGTTNINSFITSTNSFINAMTDTLQGMTYNYSNDTTTFDNNLTVNKTLLIQGMDIKAEIDALETSFTSGTINTNNLTAGIVNITNQINMTNTTRQSRNINNLGYINFCDIYSSIDNIFNISAGGSSVYFNSLADRGTFIFGGKNISGVNHNNKLMIVPDTSNGNYNPSTIEDDTLLFGAGDNPDTQSLNITVWGGTKTGVRIEPTKTTMTGGENEIICDSNNGILINGYDADSEFTKIRKVKNCSSVYYAYAYSNSQPNDVYITAFQFTTEKRFNEYINFVCPVSHIRTFQVNFDGIQWARVSDTVNVSFSITKDDVQIYNQPMVLMTNQMIKIETNEPTSFVYSYEMYLGTITHSFLPDYDEDNTHIYKIILSFSQSYGWGTDTNLGFINRSSTIKSNTTITNVSANAPIIEYSGIPSYQGATNYYTSYNYSVPTNSEYTQFTAPIVAENGYIKTLDTNDLTFTNCYGNTLNISSISGLTSPLVSPWTSIPCYYLNGSIANNTVMQSITNNIMCSYKVMSSNDDAFVVFPGYILKVYYFGMYLIVPDANNVWSGTDDESRQTRIIDNSNGTAPLFVKSQDLYGSANEVQSCKVFYKSLNFELRLPFYSYNA